MRPPPPTVPKATRGGERALQSPNLSRAPGRVADSFPKLGWHPALYRIRPGAVGDAARGVNWQARAHPRHEMRDIVLGHRSELRSDARTPENRRPVIVEIGVRPLHRDLS